MLFKNHFQIGYAVRSVDRAIESLSNTYGIRNWQVLRLPADSPGNALGFARVRGMMLELVDVKPGKVEVYNKYIPEDPAAVRLHHFGYMADTRQELEEITRRYAELGIAKVVDLEMGDILCYRYFDTMGQLGHYTEYVWLKPGGADFWAHVPEN
jgi:hypothetical protein